MRVRLPYFVVRDHIPYGGLRGANDLYNLLYIGFAYGESLTLIFGGPVRWQGEAHAIARQIPYSPYSWAAALAVSVTLLAMGILLDDDDNEDSGRRFAVRGWLIVCGAIGCAAWFAYYAWCQWLAGQLYPTQVSFNGPYVWGCFAAWYMIKVGQHLDFRSTGGQHGET